MKKLIVSILILVVSLCLMASAPPPPEGCEIGDYITSFDKYPPTFVYGGGYVVSGQRLCAVGVKTDEWSMLTTQGVEYPNVKKLHNYPYGIEYTNVLKSGTAEFEFRTIQQVDIDGFVVYTLDRIQEAAYWVYPNEQPVELGDIGDPLDRTNRIFMPIINRQWGIYLSPPWPPAPTELPPPLPPTPEP